MIRMHLPVKRLTQEPKHHFFGYFDKFCYDRSGRYLLAHEIDFTARQPQPGEKAGICLADLENDCRSRRIAESDAWCWQQGCMLQWLNDSATKIIYNAREGNGFVSRILDIATGERQTLCRPVYCLSQDGRWALSLNFSRLDRERPGYGYPGGNDPNAGIDSPEDEGIWLVDLQHNTARLIISVAQVTRAFHRPSMDHTPGWFNHLLFSPDSRRFAFFHRWRVWGENGEKKHITHMFTTNLDGSEIYPLNLEDMSSHYVWIDNSRIINFSNRHATGWQYHLFTDRTDRVEIIAKDVFPGDGHCSYSPDGRWMLTDSYPGADECRNLYLYQLTDGTAYEIGKFHSDCSYPIPTRCDLHPRWSRDGRKVCFDSTHEGSRQIYEIDLKPITNP